MLTRTEYEAMNLDEFLEWAQENLDDITTEDCLLDFAKSKIDDDNIYLALHILNAIWESGEAYEGYYRYDYSMGCLQTPTPITCKEDLEDLLDFDEEAL